jgi:hypothetical protein
MKKATTVLLLAAFMTFAFAGASYAQDDGPE